MGTDEARDLGTSLVLFERFRAGDGRAAEALFARYFDRLAALARARLAPRVARRVDPEDVVLSAYRSFFVAAREGRYELHAGGDLWRLLASIARHKLLRRVRHHRAARRSVDAESSLDPVGYGLRGDPSPSEAAALTDEMEWVFSRLDALGRRVLELRLQGLQIAEIAGDVGRSERSVRRALARVRELLAGRFDLDAESPSPSRGRRGGMRARPVRIGGDADGPSVPGLEVPSLSHRDFLLRRMIGAGSMGKVYEAWQHGAGRRVAVKFLRKSLLNHPGVVRRFLEESRTIAGLCHPNIVGTQVLGRTDGGSYFLVMDFVAGPDLAAVGRARTIAVAEAVRWAIATCAAIEHSHGRGVIHCDLKPANLLLDEDGGIRVTDFGLARALAGRTPGASEVEGTAPFMAPEQVSRRWGPIDVRTDVYGIGAVLFALLTGRPPFPGRRVPDILAAVVDAAPSASPADLRPDLPEALSNLCRKCLAKAPADRYPSARDVRLALAGLG